MSFEVTILGVSAASPIYGRNHTSQLLLHKNNYFLIDCGEGAQLQLRKYNLKFNKINHIFISHLHGDHFFGLVGLISSLHLLGRKKTLYIYGPNGLDEIITVQLKHSNTVLNFKIIFHTINSKEKYLLHENNELEIYAFPLNHRIDCSGFIFKEKKQLRKIISEKIPSAIEVYQYDDLRNGKDIIIQGIKYGNNTLTTDPPPPRSYAYCSDNRYYPNFENYLTNINTLYHEATFLDDLKNKAIQTFHTTAKEAGELAKKINAEKIIIGHFSARYQNLSPILAECKKEFENSHLAEEGKTYQI